MSAGSNYADLLHLKVSSLSLYNSHSEAINVLRNLKFLKFSLTKEKEKAFISNSRSQQEFPLLLPVCLQGKGEKDVSRFDIILNFSQIYICLSFFKKHYCHETNHLTVYHPVVKNMLLIHLQLSGCMQCQISTSWKLQHDKITQNKRLFKVHLVSKLKKIQGDATKILAPLKKHRMSENSGKAIHSGKPEE